MLREIVKKYRSVYEQKFMMQSLRTFPNNRIKTDAFDSERRGFPGKYIVVDFSGSAHNKVKAANVLFSQNEKMGLIYVAQGFHSRSKEEQKVVLAEEWLELMAGFELGKHEIHKSLSGKLPLALLFNSLKQRGFWQDSTSEHAELLVALRLLLVPKDRLQETSIELHQKTLDELKVMVTTSPDEARLLIEQLVLTFAVKFYVDKDLVWDRLMTFLIDGQEETDSHEINI